VLFLLLLLLLMLLLVLELLIGERRPKEDFESAALRRALESLVGVRKRVLCGNHRGDVDITSRKQCERDLERTTARADNSELTHDNLREINVIRWRRQRFRVVSCVPAAAGTHGGLENECSAVANQIKGC